MKRGHAILGAIAGLGFGFCLALVLLAFGVLPLDSIVVLIVPVLFLVLGAVWGGAAPLGGRAASQG